MKDITDYFASPTTTIEKKIRKHIEPEKHRVPKNEPTNEINLSPGSTNLENVNDTAKKKHLVKKKRKKSVRKSPDPAVNNITELLSNSLNFLSPENTKKVENNIFESDDSIQLNKREVETRYTCESVNETSSISKLNAFQFLMDSRHKSIGTNSPGKELEIDIRDNDEVNKGALAVRRNLLSDWAEKKGASKRKRFEEELDEVISHKLDTRAKRLKKLLQLEDTSQENDSKMNKKRKRRIRRLSDSSDSKESVIFVPSKTEELKEHETNKENTSKEESIKGNNENRNKRFEQVKKTSKNKDKDSKKHDISFSKICSNVDDESSKEGSSKQKSVFSKSKDTKKHDTLSSKKSSNKPNDESFQDSTLISPKCKDSRQSLLNFFGVKNKPKTNYIKSANLGDIDNPELLKNKDIKEIKNGSDMENTRKKREKTKTVTSELDLDKMDRQQIRAKTKKTDKLIDKYKKKMKKSERDNVDDYSENNDILNASPTTKRAEKPVIINLGESSLDTNIIPRRLRSWKMKIKISMEEQSKQLLDENIVQTIKKSIYVDEATDVLIESESGSESDILIIEEDIKNKSIKIAPIFVKANPKPKVDPEVLEARRQFLMSSMPSNVKRTVEKQESFEEKAHNIFPAISHVQQKCDAIFWNLPQPNLILTENSPLKLNESSLMCKEITNSHIVNKLDIDIETPKIDDVRNVLNMIKMQNSEYPVYKAYRYISEKTSKKCEEKSEHIKPIKKQTSRRGKRKSADNSVKMVEPEKVDLDLTEYTMWTEKYKPKSSDEIIGNTDAVNSLRSWLETWMNFSREINSKKKRRDSSSSEFETTDCDSRDSTRLPGNTMVLHGPCGSGKSTAVYAICNELGFNVIEINASSKRTGRKLLQDHQEATQSHQVRKQNSQNSQAFFNGHGRKELQPSESKRKMCVLFVEDVDIVFEQDDGFINALIQLITTSKRPIILTTTDYDSGFVQKFLSQYEHISFLPLSSYSLATWLQILCLVEGMLVDQTHIGTLLEYNQGDVRKTLLQLQFWVQSGGDIVKNEMPMRIKHVISKSDEKLVKDDNDNKVVGNSATKNCDVPIHKNCIRSFEVFDIYRKSYLPYYLNLGIIWWNIPNILHISSYSKQRIDRFKQVRNKSPKQCKRRTKYSLDEKLQLKSLTDLYDGVCLIDSYFRKVNYFDTLEPHVKSLNFVAKDSIELNERLECYDVDMEFIHDVTHSLIDGFVQEFGNENPCLDVTMPNKMEKRWRAKLHVCEDLFQEALPLSSCLDRKSVALDYFPSLRDISRSENKRAAVNTKRGNRFRNYLRSVGIHCNDNTNHIASNILKEQDV